MPSILILSKKKIMYTKSYLPKNVMFEKLCYVATSFPNKPRTKNKTSALTKENLNVCK